MNTNAKVDTNAIFKLTERLWVTYILICIHIAHARINKQLDNLHLLW